MTTRIYYTEPARRAFDAVVGRVLVHDGRPAAVLDRTAFYPASGGQPCDHGHLGPAAVVDVVDDGADVVHVLDAPLAAGEPVHGDIAWPRRFDHMQQHTGQHVLSAAFVRRFDNPTVSVHIGSETSTVDLAAEATPRQVEEAIDEANRVVWDNRPVSIRFVSSEEAARLALRKVPAREGTLRLIEIQDVDLSACGGTHVARTGEVGQIAATGVERFKGGSRVTFVCGDRALRTWRRYRDAVAGSTRVLSVLPEALPATLERLQVEAKELRRTIAGQQEALASFEAARLFEGAAVVAGRRDIVHVAGGHDAPGLKAMATALADRGGTVVALVSEGAPALVVVARSADIPVDAGAVVKALVARFGGRGGGKADFAQGGGLTGDPLEIAAVARQLLQA